MKNQVISKIVIVPTIVGYTIGADCTDILKKEDGNYGVWLKDDIHINFSSNSQFVVSYLADETSK